MKTLQIFNVMEKSVIDYCISDYESRSIYDTTTMNKAEPQDSLRELHKIIEHSVNKKLEYCSGNFYKHNRPYLPHTDFKSYQGNTINVVIPLWYNSINVPHLVIFDQVWDQDSVTWCMDYPVQYFDTNIGVKGNPSEYPVKYLTNSTIDTDLYNHHLSHYSKFSLDKLSGIAHPFEIGSLIMFDNRRIHCTSNFLGEKLGISLRFKEL
jgi:hypothetical protein